jgi:hypothetical protein
MPKNIVNFLEGEIGEAVPDIAYGGVERAPNGVSIVPDPTKNKPAVKLNSPSDLNLRSLKTPISFFPQFSARLADTRDA